MYNTIVIGAGAAGAAAARVLAENGRQVLVVERRDHVGGNCYDCQDAHGILVQPYGPHIFHTDNEQVRAFLSRFTAWRDFGHEVVAKVGEQMIPVPFNLNTLHQVYDQEKADRLEKLLVDTFGAESRVPILKLRQQEQEEIREIADYVYENIFLHYTMKQWGQTPEEIDPAVTGRVPVVISRDNRYFKDKYQGVPLEGFTAMYERMLDHENITLRLSTDADSLLAFSGNQVLFEGKPFDGEVIYTGPVDELFGCCFGRLPYRSLDFVFEHHDCPDYQGHSVINYTVSEDYTRITEFKHLTGQKCEGTTIVKEYPMAYTGADGQIPYYAIMNADNQQLYDRYAMLVAPMAHFHLLGRLAEYRYYNIDAMTARALELADQILQKNHQEDKKL